jgi:hypothetical protein
MALNLNTSKIRSEICVASKFLNFVLEKDGEDQLDQLCEKLLHRVKGERNILHKIKRRKAKLDWSHVACGLPSKTLY